MNGTIALGGLALAVASTTAFASAGFNFTFDSDAEGWTRGNLGSSFATIDANSAGAADWDSEAGNGYLAGTDHGGYAFHFSPDLGGGHGALFGFQLELDFQTRGAGANNPFVVLMSSTGFLVKQQAHVASTDLLPYAYALDASGGWYFNSSPYFDGGSAVLATDADILAVLSDLRHVGISTDIANGGDATRTDNVRAVPAPGAVSVLLGLGGLAAARRRR